METTTILSLMRSQLFRDLLPEVDVFNNKLTSFAKKINEDIYAIFNLNHNTNELETLIVESKIATKKVSPNDYTVLFTIKIKDAEDLQKLAAFFKTPDKVVKP